MHKGALGTGTDIGTRALPKDHCCVLRQARLGRLRPRKYHRAQRTWRRPMLSHRRMRDCASWRTLVGEDLWCRVELG